MSAKWWQSGTGFITNPNNTLLMGNPSNLPYICICLIPPNRLFNDPLWFSPSLYPKIALRLVLSAMDCCEADRAIESKSNIYVEKKNVSTFHQVVKRKMVLFNGKYRKLPQKLILVVTFFGMHFPLNHCWSKWSKRKDVLDVALSTPLCHDCLPGPFQKPADNQQVCCPEQNSNCCVHIALESRTRLCTTQSSAGKSSAPTC